MEFATNADRRIAAELWVFTAKATNFFGQVIILSVSV